MSMQHNWNDNDRGFPVPVPIWGEHSWLTMPHNMFWKNKLIYNLHINNSNAGGKKYIPHDLRDTALGKMTLWISANLEYNIKIGSARVISGWASAVLNLRLHYHKDTTWVINSYDTRVLSAYHSTTRVDRQNGLPNLSFSSLVGQLWCNVASRSTSFPISCFN
jgi:hypothetical protein